MRSLRCSALLFDLDGVLVDSTASIGRTWRASAARHGLDAERVLAKAGPPVSVSIHRPVSSSKMLGAVTIRPEPGERELMVTIGDRRSHSP